MRCYVIHLIHSVLIKIALRTLLKPMADLESTNGNYYLSDILKVSLLAEESGNAFHSYVLLHYSVPKRVQQLAGITNKTIKSLGLPFREVMDGLVDFLHHEQV